METNQKKAKSEILVYSAIHNWMVEYLVEQINTFDDEEEITMRLHTPGGVVMDGMALLSRLSDRKGATNIYVDGMAFSMGAYLSLYATKVVASEVARFMFHKASYPSWYEPSETEIAELEETNKKLKEKMKSRLNDSQESKDLIAKVFKPGIITDVYLSAKEAKKIGLVTEIRALDLNVKAMIEEQAKMVATYSEEFKKDHLKQNDISAEIKTNSKKMTIEELKAENPGLYSQIFAAGETSGVAKELDRVGSYLAFLEVDPKAVKDGVISGNAMTETQRSEFALASFKVLANKEETTENAETVVTAPVPTAEESAKKKYEDEIIASIGNTELTLKK